MLAIFCTGIATSFLSSGLLWLHSSP
jgi:hypothetical protein